MKKYFVFIFLCITAPAFAQSKVSPADSYTSTVLVKATLFQNGDLRGTITYDDLGFASRIKKGLLHQSPDDFREFYNLDHFSYLKIQSVNVDSSDRKNGALITIVSFTLAGFGKTTDQGMSFLPVLVPMYFENPYSVAPDRFPYQLAFPVDYTYQLEITLPDGIVVSAIPPGKVDKPDGIRAEMKRLAVSNGQTFSLMIEMNIMQKSYSKDEYAALKDFVDDYFNLCYEQVSVRKQ